MFIMFKVINRFVYIYIYHVYIYGFERISTKFQEYTTWCDVKRIHGNIYVPFKFVRLFNNSTMGQCNSKHGKEYTIPCCVQVDTQQK